MVAETVSLGNSELRFHHHLHTPRDETAEHQEPKSFNTAAPTWPVSAVNQVVQRVFVVVVAVMKRTQLLERKMTLCPGDLTKLDLLLVPNNVSH